MPTSIAAASSYPHRCVVSAVQLPGGSWKVVRDDHRDGHYKLITPPLDEVRVDRLVTALMR